MAPTSRNLVLLLQLLSCVSVSLSCHCVRYHWSSWSSCTRTCNYGTQQRERNFILDEYYWISSCYQLCDKYDYRACNEQACPINCQLTEFGPWSECSPCSKKQFRTRSVQRPSQFDGSACDVELTEERPCHPSKECRMASIDCKDDFMCDSGRCINSTLTCNNQNDCGDNSDERDCDEVRVVCPGRKPAPGADLVGNGFDALAGEPRGAVLDSLFMGGSCILQRPKGQPQIYRIPYNFESFEIKIGEVEDFSTQPQEVHTEPLKVTFTTESGKSTKDDDFFFIFPIPFVFFNNYGSSVSSNKGAFTASKKIDSKFFRVQQILPVSTFKLRDPGNLVLSLPFHQFLHALPLDYNYALYRDIFQRFGTHYYSAGSLGGHYDLMYQYNRQELTSSGETEEHLTGCLHRETAWSVILYTEYRSAHRCTNNRMTEKYQGSYIQAAEKSFSMVKGGRAREAAALAWERQGSFPGQTTYKNWVMSVLENPAVVDYKLLPIINLVRGIPCAATKRRHLRKALLQYLEEFDPCKCAPCPNNARPVLSGTECKCVCQTGTFGTNCEKRAPDYTSYAVDGYWSCWGPWSSCGATMKRHRTRRCNNPAPLRGGQYCNGSYKQEETCHISIFERQETCENDDDFMVGWRDELPPGVQGCLRPQRPPNSFLRKAKRYYDFGEAEEFQCFTGFELVGFQYINCLPDGTWSQPKGKCIRTLCLPPEIPDDMTLFPTKDEYAVGDSVSLECKEMGLMPLPRGFYKCVTGLTWEPPLPANIRCTNDLPFVPEVLCPLGQRLENSRCVCVPRESCLSQLEDLCILNTNIDVTVSMSLCSFTSGRCHGDPLFFVSQGLCNEVDPSILEWSKFRAKMSSKSSVQVPCKHDTCYEWETCSESKRCECIAARDCARSEDRMFCVKLTRNQRTRSMNLCSLGALKCASYEFEILSEGVCESR
ncbi:complement component C6 [Parambassis ranga]|uniref:Complement component C6 n=1 Tax=Parambassis ranga TaxID=210632 RepID=A0A6P7JAL6_9TELE|nr:complement component C6 [Parambassis ranga]XP_028273754.1 complement component C6 [Parambassis ranga]XP_028273755.1 complement component C6 [Parambassis ranga]XP_028273756.1 complement component C6 [Parambassis ranga]